MSDNDAPHDIPGYAIEGRLGGGGMGSVYTARHKELNRKVALKIPKASLLNDPDAKILPRLESEGKILAQLDHPNVVKVLDAGFKKNQPFIAMEFIEGENLENKIAREKPSMSTMISWYSDLADALEYLHENDVTHRDIKDENIIIDKNGKAILVDFGLAISDGIPRVSSAPGIRGTFRYMSPGNA